MDFSNYDFVEAIYDHHKAVDAARFTSKLMTCDAVKA